MLARTRDSASKTYTFSSLDYMNTMITCGQTNEAYWIEHSSASPIEPVYFWKSPLAESVGFPGDERILVATIYLQKSRTAIATMRYDGGMKDVWSTFPKHPSYSWCVITTLPTRLILMKRRDSYI
ncbi:hypothetical protein DL93DRAFT_1099934 [Clavulina sp. PMI_390]|nr:hypothetical protein DL93DRAFT_1099934 [Clavulina sp. PMI_390]